MEKINSLVLMFAAMAWMGGTCDAQNLTSYDSHFGYPSVSAAGCSGCANCGGGYGQRGNHPKWEAYKEHHGKVCARNDAWPMPFNCADRQLYFATWTNMINQGFEAQCTLQADHFDSETNELNRFGQQTVAGIMQNMPSAYKKVFIHRDQSDAISASRKRSVENMIATFYSQIAPNAQVAMSNKLPPSIRGTRAEGINRLFSESAPSPIIPVSAGNDSVRNSINN